MNLFVTVPLDFAWTKATKLLAGVVSITVTAKSLQNYQAQDKNVKSRRWFKETRCARWSQHFLLILKMHGAVKKPSISCTRVSEMFYNIK